MYKRGDVKWGEAIDSTTPDYDTVTGAYLPHSCERWVIGGKKQIMELILDLQTILRERL
jgi:hypothetical protein